MPRVYVEQIKIISVVFHQSHLFHVSFYCLASDLIMPSGKLANAIPISCLR